MRESTQPNQGTQFGAPQYVAEGQLWHDGRPGPHARVVALVEVPRHGPVAVLQRCSGVMRSSHKPFLVDVATLRAGLCGWRRTSE